MHFLTQVRIELWPESPSGKPPRLTGTCQLSMAWTLRLGGPREAARASEFEGDADHYGTCDLSGLLAQGDRCQSSILAVNADSDRRDVRKDGGKVPPTTQHLLAIVVLAGMAGDKSQPTLLQFGLGSVTRIDRMKGTQGITELGPFVLNRLGSAPKHLGRQRP